jgi:phosphonate transport system substrate-binding protein
MSKTLRIILIVVAALIIGIVLYYVIFMMGGPAPLGSEENPIVWGFVPSGEVERVATGAQTIADMLHESTGYYFETTVATDYPSVIEGMCSDPPEVQMSSLATFAYIVAADRGCAEAALLSVRYGSPTYNGQFIVRADSGLTSVEDIATTDDLTWCRSEPFSTSGWIIPSIMLAGYGIDPETHFTEIVDTGAHESNVTGVYDGTCDAGATYVDARTRVEEDYPDVMDVVVVVGIEPDIPNDGVQFVPSFPADMRAEIVAALDALDETEEGIAALDIAYQWSELAPADDSVYDAFRQILNASGIDPVTLMGE